MKSEFATQKYEVHLPVAVWDSNLSEGRGVTEYMSSHDICFSVDNPPAIAAGTAIMLFVSLPAEVTGGSKVQLRASGRVLRVEPGIAPNAKRVNLVAAMDWYDFIRADAKEPRFFELQCAASASAGSASSSVRISAKETRPQTDAENRSLRIAL
jgi:hypothetical protein